MYPTKPIDDKRVSGWALEYTDLPIMDERTLRLTEHCPDCGRVSPLVCGRPVCDYLDNREG